MKSMERATNKQRATSGARTGTPGLPFPGCLSTFECQCGHQCTLDEMDTVLVVQGRERDSHVYGEDMVLRCRFCGAVDPDLTEVEPDYPVEP